MLPFNLRTLSTLLGIMLGVAALTASFNFCDTTKKEIYKSIEGMTSNVIAIKNNVQGMEVNPKKTPSNISDIQSARNSALTLKDADILSRHVDEISHVTPALKTMVSALIPGSKGNLFSIYGVNPEFETILRATPREGRFFYPYENSCSKRVCLVTEDIAKNIFNNQSACGKTLTLYDVDLRIIGVLKPFENTPFFEASNSVFLPYHTFMRLTDHSDSPDFIILNLKPGADNRRAVGHIDNLLNRAGNCKSYTIWDQRIFIEKKKQMASTIEWLVNSISLLILLVACVSCSNIMVLAVNQRRQEIGVRRALGATRADILGLFLFEGFLLIFLGGMLGIGAAYFLTQGILQSLPNLISTCKGYDFQFTAFAVIKVLGVLCVMAAFSSLIPAWHASKMDPVEALRRT